VSYSKGDDDFRLDGSRHSSQWLSRTSSLSAGISSVAETGRLEQVKVVWRANES
jgi:hypothetical protein